MVAAISDVHVRSKMEPFQDARYPFDHAGLYEIHVVGDVDVSTFEYLAGMTSVHCGPSD